MLQLQLEKKVLPHLKKSEIQNGVTSMQPQRRMASKEELRAMRNAGVVSNYTSHIILVELRGACSLVKQLTGSAALALALGLLGKSFQDGTVPGALAMQLFCQRLWVQELRSEAE